MIVRPDLDARDAAIIAARADLLGLNDFPDCGDFVVFADGIRRRVSYVWESADWGETAGTQTSDGGRWYLGEGYVSFSGGLYPSVPLTSLTLTPETRLGSVWIFHHNWATAGNGVDTQILFRVWLCDRPAPR